MTTEQAQQSGPVPTQINGGISNEVLLERLEALGAEVALLRSSAGQGSTRSRSSTVSGATAMFVPGATHERSEAASRSLNAVSNVALPEGGVWRGSQDARSVRRFLDSVSRRVQASGLGPHAAFFYLVNKCLPPGLAEEMFCHCPATRQAPVDYGDACREASEFLMRTFQVTNQPARFIERLEALTWARECPDFDAYRQSFHRMVREAELLDVQMTCDNKRRLFVKALPVRLRQMIEERFLDDVEVERLIEMLDAWLARRTDNPFAAGAEAVPKKVSVRAVGEEDQQEAVATAARGSSAPQNTAPWAVKCYACGEPGHIRAHCPKKHAFKQAGPAPTSARTAAPPVLQGQPAAGGGRNEDIPWKAASLRVAGAGADRHSPRSEVTLSDVRGEGCVMKQVVLLDTGAEVTCCSKAFADKLYRAGVVKDCDVRMGYKAFLSMADDATQIKPLGTVRLAVDGRITEVVVVPARLCADFIVGYDQLTANPNLFRKLIADMAERAMNSPESSSAGVQIEGSKVDYFASVAVGPEVGTASREESGVDDGAPGERNELAAAQEAEESHCEWPPVSLRWKQGALEGLRPNLRQAHGEARQLEARMARKRPSLLAAYREVLDSWISNGWLEQVDEGQVKFCLRHFGVEKDKDGLTAMARCRVVVDGAALTPLLQVPSCSHTDMVRNLVLWRSADAFTVLDISQAYMRIRISDVDSHYLCIAWNGRFFRFRSIPMGISPSAQILQEIVDTYIGEYLEGAPVPGMEVRVAPYMDDLVQCGWFTRHVPPDERQSMVEEMECRLKSFLTGKRMKVSEGKTLRPCSESGALLGVRFSRERISASSKLRKLARGELIIMGKNPMTRREALGWLSSLYDPLGLVVEVLMRARLLAQQLGGLAWDRPVPQSLSTEVCRWIELCQVALEWDAPRKLNLRTLFVFTDASTVGIACVAVCRGDDGKWYRLMAKAKTFKKHQRAWTGVSSKIELLALQAGLELAQYICEVGRSAPEGFGVEKVIVGTDSEVNLNRFAARKFEDIVDRWESQVSLLVNNGLANLCAAVYHLPGAINPADAPSRGIWAGSSDPALAVEWYHVERAVFPERYGPWKGRPEDNDTDADEDRVVVGGDSEVPQVEWTQAVARSERAISLEARYVVESADGVSRADWLRIWQETDPAFPELVRKGTVELHEGVWTLRYTQSLYAQWCWPVYVPAALVPNALVSVHDGVGHFGFSKTLMKARSQFFWPRMAVSVKAHCRKCLICQRIKGSREWSTEAQPVAVDGVPWSVVGVDITKGFDPGDSHVVLTATCLFTRYVFSFLLPKEEAKRIVETLKGCFALEGCPRIIVTDNGSVFTSDLFRKFLRDAGVGHKCIPRHAPWYGGFYEVSHKTLTRTLVALMMQEEAKDWRRVLMLATYLYNCRPYEHCTGVERVLSPQEVFRGRKAEGVWVQGDLDLEDSLRVGDGEAEEMQRIARQRAELLRDYEEVWKRMRNTSAREIARRQRGSVSYKVGDHVFVYVPRPLRAKVDAKWAGPYVVDEVLTPTTWRVNGKPEHGYNLKAAVLPDAMGTDGTGGGDVPRNPPLGKREREDDHPSGGKRMRLRALLASMPRGDLLWLS